MARIDLALAFFPHGVGKFAVLARQAFRDPRIRISPVDGVLGRAPQRHERSLELGDLLAVAPGPHWKEVSHLVVGREVPSPHPQWCCLRGGVGTAERYVHLGGSRERGHSEDTSVANRAKCPGALEPRAGRTPVAPRWPSGRHEVVEQPVRGA